MVVFGRVNGNGTVFYFPVSFIYTYIIVTGMIMAGWGIGNHSVGIMADPYQSLSSNQFRMEENGGLAPGMNAEYIAIGY